MSGDKTRVVILCCPGGHFPRGAEFTRPEILAMAYDGSLPSGTYWRYKEHEHLFYQGVRYTLTADGDVD